MLGWACLCTPARADEMDASLSRLRIAAGDAGCDAAGAASYCPDDELFERLAFDLGGALAPPVTAPAHGVGVTRFSVALDATLTPIEAGAEHWELGTRGDGAVEGRNDAPPSLLWWNRVELRKGLPFGFEAGASFGQAPGTSRWSFGGHARWTPFEGFESGWGRLPDLAVRAAVVTAVSDDALALTVYAVDLVFSKPFVLRPGWRVAPFVGAQAFLVDAESDVIDLSPGVEGDEVRFADVAHVRGRAVAGAQARWDSFTLALSVMADLVRPDLDAMPTRSSDPLARQLSVSLSLGAVL